MLGHGQDLACRSQFPEMKFDTVRVLHVLLQWSCDRFKPLGSSDQREHRSGRDDDLEATLGVHLAIGLHSAQTVGRLDGGRRQRHPLRIENATRKGDFCRSCVLAAGEERQQY